MRRDAVSRHGGSVKALILIAPTWLLCACSTVAYTQFIAEKTHRTHEIDMNERLFSGYIRTGTDNSPSVELLFDQLLLGRNRIVGITMHEDPNKEPIIKELSARNVNVPAEGPRVCLAIGSNSIRRIMEFSAAQRECALCLAMEFSGVNECKIAYLPCGGEEPTTSVVRHYELKVSALDLKWRQRSKALMVLVPFGYIGTVLFDIATSPVQLALALVISLSIRRNLRP